jgi:hypothetical protein
MKQVSGKKVGKKYQSELSISSIVSNGESSDLLEAAIDAMTEVAK